MPASGSKLKAKNGAIKRRGATPQSHELSMEEVGQGRLPVAQWEDMLRQEDTEDAVGEIIDKLLEKVMERCYRSDINRQLLPFSICWARKLLVDVLELRFLHLDEGEAPDEGSRTEDCEPLPLTTDSWAQGCVPIIHVEKQGSGNATETGKNEAGVNKQCLGGAQRNISPERFEKDKKCREPADFRSHGVFIPAPPPKGTRSKRRPPPSHTSGKEKESLAPQRQVPARSAQKGHKQEDEKRGLPCVSTDKSEPPHRAEEKQPPLPRIDYTFRPLHFVSPQVEILDTPKKASGLPGVAQRGSKPGAFTTNAPRPLTKSLDQPTKLQRGNSTRPVSFSVSLRLDDMDLSQGVSSQGSTTLPTNKAKAKAK